MRGDADTGERTDGNDYYQDMMLWALPAALAGKDLRSEIMIELTFDATRWPDGSDAQSSARLILQFRDNCWACGGIGWVQY